MAIEFDDRAFNIIGNNVKALNFFDDDRTLQARIFLDENNRLNIGNFQTEGGENGTEGGSLDLSDVGFLTIAATGSLNQERIFTAGDGISASDAGGNSSFTVSVKESEVDHDALLNFVADEHVAHSGVTISAGSGLTGGGDITVSRTINLDTPGTLSVSSSDSATGNHTHAITASANPGAAAALLKSTASGGLTLELLDVDNVRLDGTTVSATAGDLTLDASGGDVVLPSAVNIGTDHFVSELTGWRIDYDGSADFRDIFADELRVRAFIADIEQALAGGQIVSKSVALLSRDTAVPVGGRDIVNVSTANDWFEINEDLTGVISDGQSFDVAGSTGNNGGWIVDHTEVGGGGTTTLVFVTGDITDGTVDGEVRFKTALWVEDLPGFPDTAVFAASDWLRLRAIDRSGGGLVVADVWGTVSSYSDAAGGEQSWTFTCRDDGGVPGDTIYAGALALDYGASGDGYWEVTALGNDVPYSQIVTWATDPSVSGNHTLKTRVGNLDGVTDGDFPTLGGFGFYSDNAFLKGEIWAASGSVVINTSGLTIDGDDIFTIERSGTFVGRLGTEGDQTLWLRTGDGTQATRNMRIVVDASSNDVQVNLDAGTGPGYNVSIGGTQIWGFDTADANLNVPLDISGDLTVDTDTLFVDASADSVGINTATPGAPLDVRGNKSGHIAFFFNDGNASDRDVLTLRGGQDANPSNTFVYFRDGDGTVVGSVAGDGAGGVNYNQTSDEQIKTDVAPLPPGALTRILALEPVTYRGKGAPPERGKRTGLIAQQVRDHVPDVVSEGEDGLLGIDYGRLVPELIGAIQELNAELETLRGTL